MTGEPLLGRAHDESAPLPPAVRLRRVDDQPDAALKGTPLPPFHRGLPPVRWYGTPSAPDSGAEPAPAAAEWDETGHEQEAIDTWEARRAAWDAEFAPLEEEAVEDAEPAPPWGRAESSADASPESEALTMKPWGGADEPAHTMDPAAFDAGPAAADEVEPPAFDVGPSGGEDIVAGEPPWAEKVLEREPAAALEADVERPQPEPEPWSEVSIADEGWTRAADEAEPGEHEPAPWSEVSIADEGWGRAVEEAGAGEHEPAPVAPGWDDSWSGADEPDALDLPVTGEAAAPAGDVEAVEAVSAESEAMLEAAAIEQPAAEAAVEAAAEPIEAAAEAAAEPVDATAEAEAASAEAESVETAARAQEEGVDEWLAGGAAGAFPWDAAAEAAARLTPDADAVHEPAEPPPALAPAEAPAGEPPVWESWETEDDAAPLPAEAGSDAWTADQEAFTAAAAGFDAEEARASSPTAEPAQTAATEDEIVARMPATPLDAWYHADAAAGASETWESFGRALEEAASWGDLGSTIATGLPPDQQQAAEAAAESMSAAARPEAAPEAVAPETEPAASADATPTEVGTAAPRPTAAGLPLEDLAGRLEQLARRLRAEGGKGVEQALSEGDRLEASLAGFIAGYVAARNE